jgi:hypothetical protein
VSFAINAPRRSVSARSPWRRPAVSTLADGCWKLPAVRSREAGTPRAVRSGPAVSSRELAGRPKKGGRSVPRSDPRDRSLRETW